MKAALMALEGCSLWQTGQLARVLVKNDWRVRTLTLQGSPIATDGGQRIVSDGKLEEAVAMEYNMVLLPGGDYATASVFNAHAMRFLRQADGHNAWIAATGRGVALLAAAGMLGGLRVAVDEPTKIAFPTLFTNMRLVMGKAAVDGNIVTAHATADAEVTEAVAKYVRLLTTL
ncbi:MAG: DJ-1/PfpI family protein [Alicyclobacillaceae bacterium]|jgi:putative intracellular protease/amidase|uniref:DJ-1/PfpI family protein n=1 Tax=Alicyclobacillus sp. SP_1 TaxID=2942475 RepID=UPI0021577026|nr:DJ-1/PfpI family protein [Alicyclobacillus sp. SP_1]MCY0887493.1 DJ-1/PfpI family protein [Alicyclobacillaceae bacterium]